MSKRGKHTHTDKDTKPAVVWLESLDIVQRVILGVAEACRHKHKPGHLKYQSTVAGGVRLTAYTGNGVRRIFVSIKPEHVSDLVLLIAKRFGAL